MPVVLCYNTRRDSGKKVRSRKLKKELKEMNRETITLCVRAVLASDILNALKVLAV